MQFRTRTWALLSVLLFIGAIVFWQLGEREAARRGLRGPVATNQQETPAPIPADTKQTAGNPGVKGSAPAAYSQMQPDPRFPYRLRNTAETVNQVAERESGILLENALIDTDIALPLVPEALRADATGRSYVVQFNSAITPETRANLEAHGATVVSYIPNNAYLVRVGTAQADQINTLAEVKSVFPFDPYYKIQSGLLSDLLENKLPGDLLQLRVTVFPGEEQFTRSELSSLGVAVAIEEPSPFGQQFIVEAAHDQLTPLARLDSVQLIELHQYRAPANDLTRVQIGITTNSTSSASTHLNLEGEGMWININDTGVDRTHPGLSGRVFGGVPLALQDTFGHGTHVAGTLAGSGANSPDATQYLSEEDADFKGMAPAARLFALPIDFTPRLNAHVTDTWLQEIAARTNYHVFGRTNMLISNNSWYYPLATTYDSSAARFDSAVRDALPGDPGSQSMFYVFPAGNLGEGGNGGLGGIAGGIGSPGTAKNVITVGAIEHFRNITIGYTNTTVQNGQTNTTPVTPYQRLTDSENEVAGFSSRGNVSIGTEGEAGRFKPDVVAPGTFVISARSSSYREEAETANTNLQKTLKQVNDPLRPSYRFGTGTTYAAPVVSGMAALIQEFFEKTLRRPISPALMKALIINGSRSVNSLYDVSPRGLINYQGWGLPDLTRSLPEAMRGPESQWPLRFVDQHATNAIGTGENRSWSLTLRTNATDLPLRVTLVWTDPPGNPAAGIKLVNDLDLVVSSPSTGVSFYGNDIEPGTDFNRMTPTNGVPVRDFVNNVENVFIPNPAAAGSNLVISVIGRKVNVSAVPDLTSVSPTRTNNIVQDFALVISSGGTAVTNAFTLTSLETNITLAVNAPQRITNGLPILNQTVGANPSLVPGNGWTNQWSFYVFTNRYDSNAVGGLHTLTNGTNVAIVTFLPGNLSRPRNFEGDLDMYVSRDARLTNLHPVALAAADRSVTRNGSEFIVYTNATPDDVFYIGIKSEDQQAVEFGIMAVSTDLPFEQEEDGRRRINLFPTGIQIQDGSPSAPQASISVGIPLSQGLVSRTIVQLDIVHENVGDLLGTLRHGQGVVVLNNHTEALPGLTNFSVLYDDSSLAPIGPSVPTDGPGSLVDFVGMPAMSPWFLYMVDNSPGQSGNVLGGYILLETVEDVDLADRPQGLTMTVTRDRYFYIDIPQGVAHLAVNAETTSGGANPLQLFLRKNDLPTTTVFDRAGTNVTSSLVSVTHSITNTPPLTPGRYYLLIHNPNPSQGVSIRLWADLQFSPAFNFLGQFSPTNSLNLLDDARTNSTLYVTRDMAVNDLRVAVRLDHPRVSDLQLRLVSPQGTRVVLSENRGGNSTNGFGFGDVTNGLSYAVFTEKTNGATPIKFAAPPFGSLGGPFVDTFSGADFNALPVGPANRNTPLGFAWRVASNVVQITTAGVTGNAVEFQQPAAIAGDLLLNPGEQYTLRFQSRRPGVGGLSQFSSGMVRLIDLNGTTRTVFETRSIRATQNWVTNSITFVAPRSGDVLVEIYSDAAPLAIDNIELILTRNKLFLPEEPLDILRGERAAGEWALEVWDTRAGAAGTNAITSLVDWKLEIDFEFPEFLAAFLPPGGIATIYTNDFHVFYVDTCDDTTNVTVRIRDMDNRVNSLRLLTDRQGFPSGFSETDDFISVVTRLNSNNVSQAEISISRDGPAPLVPGRRLYFAVENVFRFRTNTYQIEAIVSPFCPTAGAATPVNNNVPVNGSVDGNGSITHFVFNVSPNATNVSFNLLPSGPGLALLVARSEQATLDTFHYFSDEPGSSPEMIVVDATSAPVPLAPGLWYIGVWNPSPTPVDFTLTVRQMLFGGDPVDPTVFQIVRAEAKVDLAQIFREFEIEWTSTPGATYTVQATTNLLLNMPSPWVDLTNNYPAAPNTNRTIYIDRRNPANTQFYRVRRE